MNLMKKKCLKLLKIQKFISIVTDAEAAMQVAKRKITNKYPYIMAIRCIAHHINLITKDIIFIKYVKTIL